MILETLVLSLIIQTLFFVFAAWFKSDKVTDLSYSLSFIALAAYGLFTNQNAGIMQYLIFALVTAWGLRLGSYLFVRILKIKKDTRFDGIREHFWRFAKFWFFQGIVVWLVMLPSLVILESSSVGMYWLTLIGVLGWLKGFIFETVADYQKFSFRNNPQNTGKWISTGLYKYSQYPNYFGEMLMWWSIFLIALPFLNEWYWLSIIGPLIITITLLFGTGIPTLKKSAHERWGKEKNYQEYVRKTSTLIPWFPKK